jgi:hypothetical protein
MWVKLTQGRLGGKEYLKQITDAVFFGELLDITIGAFFELCISGYINISCNSQISFGEKASYFTACVGVFLCLFVLPCAFIWVLSHEK